MRTAWSSATIPQRPPTSLGSARPPAPAAMPCARPPRSLAALPAALSRRVNYVEVATVDQISLVLRDDRRVVWGSAEESAEKAEVLAQLLKQPARTYDVSVPGQPATSG